MERNKGVRMNKKILWIAAFIVLAFGIMSALIDIAVNNGSPAKGYKIKIKETVYETNSYIIDGEYIVFTDEFGRDVEVHKNFVSVEEVR